VPTSKKSRGHKRLWKEISEWIESNKELDTNQLFNFGRHNIKVPLSEDYSTNSRSAEYKRKTRSLILKGLLDIHDQWKQALDKIGEPYYLKIWLYDNRFSNSQVVCAIGPYLDFYETTFHKPEAQKEIDLSSYGALTEQMKELTWQYAWDEEHYNNTSLGEIEEYETENKFYASRRWFKKRLKKSYRKMNNSNPESEIKEYHSFRYGTVWIGGKD